MENKNLIKELVAKARIAQSEYEKFSQEQVDAVVKAVAKVVYDNAEILEKWQLKRHGWASTNTR